MTQLASDNFNRADNADLGSQWQPQHGGGWKIVSNHGEPSNLSLDSSEYYDDGVTVFPADQYAQGTIGGSGGTPSSSTGPGVQVRGGTTIGSADGYQVFFAVGAGSNGALAGKFIAGAFTQLGSVIATAAVAGDIVRLEISGSTLTYYRNGAALTTRTDSSLTTGKPGTAYSSSQAAASLDDWSGGDLVTTFWEPAPTFDYEWSRQ